MPQHHPDLLVATVLSSGSEAIELWNQWRQNNSVDAILPPLALNHRLIPALCRILAPLGDDYEYLPQLESAAQVLRERAAKQWEVFAAFALTLNRDGIVPRALKGLAILAEGLMESEVRPMVDFDLFAPQQEIPRLLKIFTEAGWLHTAFSERDRKYYFEVNLTGPSGTMIDLHWNVLHEARRSDFDRLFWENSRLIDYRGISLEVPSLTAMLFHSVVHAYRKTVVSKIWVMDAAAMLSRNQIDWEYAVRLSEKSQTILPFRAGLRVLADCYGLSIPATVLRRVAKSKLTTIEQLERLSQTFPSLDRCVVPLSIFMRAERRDSLSQWAQEAIEFCRAWKKPKRES